VPIPYTKRKSMTDARHFCPDCGNIEIQITRKYILMPEAEDSGASANCPNCGWEGPLSSTVGAVTSESFWDMERVASVLLRVVAKHATGPFVQVMEFAGLLPRERRTTSADPAVIAEVRAHNEMRDEARDAVLREMLAATITAGFEEASKWHEYFSETHEHPAYAEAAGDEVYGGDSEA
jgi:predicted RNA-binding Zn-ribbon protein involved in translation (DUF1610 family)